MHTGIDLGFGCTGILTLNDKGDVIRETFFGSKISKEFEILIHAHPAYRLKCYQKALVKHFNRKPRITGTVVIEEPMGRLIGKSREIVALKGAYLVSIPSIIPWIKIFLPKPTQIKRIFTGNGKADKEEVIAKCIEFGYNPPNDHVADAYAMARMSFEGDMNALV